MESKPQKSRLEELSKELKKISKNYKDWEDLFHFSLSEEWFSNMFARLMDPKDKGYFGHSFSKKFIQVLAKKRKENSGKKVNRSHLVARRREKDSKGKSITNLAEGVKNAGVIREFPLGTIGSKGRQGFCDIVLIDLDKKDSFTLVVENKLFTHNHSNQLTDYRSYFEEVFHGEKYREYVYLTLNGISPKEYVGCNDVNEDKYWVRFSWLKDIYEILVSLNKGAERNHKNVRINNLIDTLGILRKINGMIENDDLDHSSLIKEAKKDILWSFGNCFKEALNSLMSKTVNGDWRIEIGSRDELKFQHLWIVPPQHHAKKLKLSLEDDLSFVIQDDYLGKRSFKKILVPSQIPQDQIVNFLAVMARNVYKGMLTNPRDYLGDTRRKIHETSLEDLSETIAVLHKYAVFLKIISKLEGVSNPGLGKIKSWEAA